MAGALSYLLSLSENVFSVSWNRGKLSSILDKPNFLRIEKIVFEKTSSHPPRKIFLFIIGSVKRVNQEKNNIFQ